METGDWVERITRDIRSHERNFFAYDNESTQSLIKSILPGDFLSVSATDRIVRELAAWFPTFFRYVDFGSFPCRACNTLSKPAGEAAPTMDERLHGGRCVEVYRCPACDAKTRFPRYNSVERLLETRVGRCGEFANVFGAILDTLGFDVRVVVDWTDHVWVDYWSSGVGRYVAVDPCYNFVDLPLVYEEQRGKELLWVVAVSRVQCVDVTATYTRKLPEVVARRREMLEEEVFERLLEEEQQRLLDGADDDVKQRVHERQGRRCG
jgi:peptide-N4-(N-acetyl-beta-glucosaminyl)asparagine amidase